MKFNDNPSSGSQTDTCRQAGGWMDKYGEAINHFYRVRESALEVNSIND